MESAFRAHYEAGVERGRLLTDGEPGLELVRTLELLARYLPKPPGDVLDVGGGPGVYASALARDGYRVRLVDVLPMHVEQAAAVSDEQPEAPFETRVGDARDLGEENESADAVLLLGPLYHLTERADRVQALGEAHRVLRPGGVVLAVGISKFASLLDGLLQGFLVEPAFSAIVERDLREGQHRNPADHPGWFTTAFFHHPDELATEVSEAGFALEQVLGIEGPGWLFPSRWAEPPQREAILKAARAVEADPALRAVSAHLLAVAQKSQ